MVHQGSNPGGIGRITPAGEITEFTVGLTPNSAPVGIAAGPDDNMWFTEFADPGRIAKISAGCLTPPTPSPPLPLPTALTVRPWFTG